MGTGFVEVKGRNEVWIPDMCRHSRDESMGTGYKMSIDCGMVKESFQTQKAQVYGYKIYIQTQIGLRFRYRICTATDDS